MKKLLLTITIVSLLVGCATAYKGIITVTSVVKTTKDAWAEASAMGLTSPQIDYKFIDYHNRYRAACNVAQEALIAYKQTGDQTAYIQAYTVVRAIAADLIAIVAPILDKAKATKLQSDFDKAATL